MKRDPKRYAPLERRKENYELESRIHKKADGMVPKRKPLKSDLKLALLTLKYLIYPGEKKVIDQEKKRPEAILAT